MGVASLAFLGNILRDCLTYLLPWLVKSLWSLFCSVPWAPHWPPTTELSQGWQAGGDSWLGGKHLKIQKNVSDSGRGAEARGKIKQNKKNKWARDTDVCLSGARLCSKHKSWFRSPALNKQSRGLHTYNHSREVEAGGSEGQGHRPCLRRRRKGDWSRWTDLLSIKMNPKGW